MSNLNFWIMDNAILDFNKVYADQYGRILIYVSSRINDKMSAEEITQDTFVRLAQNLHKYDPTRAKVNTWIYRICQNIIIDFLRKQKNESSKMYMSDYTDDDGSEASNQQVFSSYEADDNMNNVELMDKIILALNTLSGTAKIVFELFFLEQKKYDEISEILNVPMGSVKGTLSRAKGKMQGLLSNEYMGLA